MIELKSFVAETLREIVEGVVEAQGHVRFHGALVSPLRKREGVSGVRDWRPIQDVEFDVELTASEAEASKGGLGVFVGGIGAGGSKEDGTQRSSAGRIKFKVPLLLPTYSD